MSKYSNALIYYFSGTGNAKKTALWISKTMEESGINTHIINIDRFKKIEIPALNEGSTIVGFCSATHGFNLPPIMLDFIFKFPKIKKSDVFIANTRGGLKIFKLFTPGLSGVAQIFPALILLLKGFKIIGMKPVDLPSNWISLHPGLNKKTIESIYTYRKKGVEKFAQKLVEGKKVYRALYDLPLDLLISPIALGYYFVGRFALAKTFISTDKCNNCELCEKQCPTNAIINSKKQPFWTYKCESCMRCMNICPKRAIETTHGFTGVLWYLIMAIIIPPLLKIACSNRFYTVAEDSITGKFIYWVPIMFATLAISFVAYRAIHFLMRFKLINKLITFTSLTKFKFWNRYKVPKKF